MHPAARPTTGQKTRSQRLHKRHASKCGAPSVSVGCFDFVDRRHVKRARRGIKCQLSPSSSTERHALWRELHKQQRLGPHKPTGHGRKKVKGNGAGRGQGWLVTYEVPLRVLHKLIDHCVHHVVDLHQGAALPLLCVCV